MCDCYLISEARFRQLQPRLASTVPWRDLETHFRTTHRLDVPPLLGETCLADICQRLADATPTPEDTALLAALEEYLAASILARWLVAQPNVRFDAQGLVTGQDETYQPATPEQWRWQWAQAVAAAESARARFRTWLYTHREDYPCLPPNACAIPLPAFADVPWGGK